MVKHYKDPFVPDKLQFFAFVASIFQTYLAIFKTSELELEKIFNQLMRLVFRKDVIDQASAISKKIKKGWLTNRKNY